ncbi:MAG: 30S ribosomal protein S6--L-glutamate ligase [Actinobacteria bacterium]|mgnify:CR=1 FL=1|nr:MAG: 30S ribosomal protein S6--L-glutamate ligase [Actinomycetota bacterium]REK39133.1 MAG: 30S ribosomal protein S6--L-glutamate ligase [Actinomycetota bacterium]
MKIAILSRSSSLYSTKRLKEAAIERGHEAVVVDYLRCYMDITGGRPKVLYRHEEVRPDAVIPRIGATYTFYGTAVVRQFEMADVFTAVSSEGISRSRDKLRSMQLLSRAGVGLPTTSFAHSTQDVQGVIEVVGGAPVVVKLLEGTQGLGVVLAETKKAAESVIGAFRQLDANILVQQFIKEAGGADIRAFVVDGKVVAAMKRQGAAGDFRSNLHAGGTATVIKLTPKERATAIRAAKTMGLAIAGVDMIQSESGPMVLEVNSSPGLEGIEKASEKDIAGEIIDYIEGNAEIRAPRRVDG